MDISCRVVVFCFLTPTNTVQHGVHRPQARRGGPGHARRRARPARGGARGRRRAREGALRGGGGEGHRGDARARSHWRFAPPLIHFEPYSLPYSVPLFLNRQCDRTLGDARHRAAAHARARGLHRPHPRARRPAAAGLARCKTKIVQGWPKL